MALKDLFNQSLNQTFPSRLPGTAYGWDTSSTNKEVQLDPSTSADVELLPSMAVKLSGRAGQTKYVSPCTKATDVPYGFIIYKAKALISKVGFNDMFTVARFGQEMAFAFKTSITAGDPVYVDPTDGFATSSSSDTILVGLAVETVASASDSVPVIATVEIQCPTVAQTTAVSPTIGNATLTITSGGVSKGTFTANATEDVTIEIA